MHCNFSTWGEKCCKLSTFVQIFYGANIFKRNPSKSAFIKSLKSALLNEIPNWLYVLYVNSYVPGTPPPFPPPPQPLP